MTGLDSAPTNSRIGALTGLRFFAALAVLLLHYSGLTAYPSWLQRLTIDGGAGVGLFFILSGFVLFYNYHRWFENGVRAPEYRRFARARFARVYPMYALALMLGSVVVIYYFRTYPAAMHQWFPAYPRPQTLALSWLANLLLLQVYVPTTPFEQLWNPPSWSVACEAVFYVAFPFFVAHIVVRSRSVSSLIRLCLVLFAIEAALCLLVALVVMLSPVKQKVGVFDYVAVRVPFMRAWEFFLGCTLAAIHQAGRRESESHWIKRLLGSTRVRNVALIVTVVLMLVLDLSAGSIGGDGNVLTILHAYLLYTPLFAMLILVLAAGPTIAAPLLENRLVVLLGEASYALYITQWIPVSILGYGGTAGVHFGSGAGAIALVGCVAASVALFKTVETPARRMLRGRQTPIVQRAALRPVESQEGNRPFDTVAELVGR